MLYLKGVRRMYKHIVFRDYHITFDVEMPTRVTVVDGDSGTCKSYFVEALARISRLGPDRCYFPRTQAELDAVGPNARALVVVDRADTLTLNVTQINSDTNGYILIMRYPPHLQDVSYIDFTVEGDLVKGGDFDCEP